MDRSVYTPGAGHLPPVLAGRDGVLHAMTVRLNDVATVGRTRSEDVVFTGVRGVGKTALLTAYSHAAARQGFEVISHQAVAGQAGLVKSVMARAALRIDQGAGAWSRARRALERVSGVTFGVAGVSAEISLHDRADPPAGGRVHPEALAFALAALADEVRRDTPAGGVLLTVDELQVAAATDLPLLAATLHRLNVDHPTAAIAFAGTGLPHLPAVLRDAGVTHPDRLLLLEELPPVLTPAEALYAVIEPARQAGIRWEPDAAAQLVQLTNGYPAHLQLFADETWRAAVGPDLITTADVTTGAAQATDRLVRQTLGPRLDDLPARHLEYLTALAVHGGRATTKQLAATLGRTHKELSWIRDALIRTGDIYSPARGHLIMAVPALAGFLLTHYDTARDHTDIELLPLVQLQHNASLGTQVGIGSGPPPTRPPDTNAVDDPRQGAGRRSGDGAAARIGDSSGHAA